MQSPDYDNVSNHFSCVKKSIKILNREFNNKWKNMRDSPIKSPSWRGFSPKIEVLLLIIGSWVCSSAIFLKAKLGANNREGFNKMPCLIKKNLIKIFLYTWPITITYADVPSGFFGKVFFLSFPRSPSPCLFLIRCSSARTAMKWEALWLVVNTYFCQNSTVAHTWPMQLSP